MGRGARDASRPLLWMHAPSVGEGLQARPILELARSRRPDLQIAYTHFSPSAAAFARSLDVDFADYLPFDTPGDARAALDALQPTALVFSKLDVWPMITREATSARSASASSARRWRAARRAGRLGRARCCATRTPRSMSSGRSTRRTLIASCNSACVRRRSPSPATRATTKCGPAPKRSPRITVAPAPPRQRDHRRRIDLAVRRSGAAPRVRRAAPRGRRRATRHRAARTDEKARRRIARVGRAKFVARDRLDEATSDTDIVVVDRVGVLGDLYALADIAFVGGGFHAAGLHSVLEPAAFGAPVSSGHAFKTAATPRSSCSATAGHRSLTPLRPSAGCASGSRIPPPAVTPATSRARSSGAASVRPSGRSRSWIGSCARLARCSSHHRGDGEDGIRRQSLARVFVEEREHIGGPDGDAGQRKVVPIVRRLSDRRIDPQSMRLAQLREACIDRLAGVERIVVLRVNGEERSANVRQRGEEPSANLQVSGPSCSRRSRREPPHAGRARAPPAESTATRRKSDRRSRFSECLRREVSAEPQARLQRRPNLCPATEAAGRCARPVRARRPHDS